MALGLLWQDWITVCGGVGQAVVQSANDYADLAGLHDVIAFFEVSAFTESTLRVFLEVSPTLDESLFTPLTYFNANPTGVKVMPIGLSFGMPWGQYLRWRLEDSGPVEWDITFRLVLAGYPSRRSLLIRQIGALTTADNSDSSAVAVSPAASDWARGSLARQEDGR